MDRETRNRYQREFTTRQRELRAAGVPIDPKWHGTANGYGNLCCRCDECKAYGAAQNRAQKAARLARPTPEHVHGTPNGYGNWGCRCDDCKAAWSADNKARNARKKGTE